MGVLGVEIVAGVIATFFVIGIVCGVLLALALAVFRGGRFDRASRRDWKNAPGPDDDDLPPRWPGRRG
jgi:hypothetical protein